MAQSVAPPAHPHADRLVALLSIVEFWLFYFVLNTIRAALDGSPDQLSMLGRRCVVTLVGMALTGVLYLVLRRVEGRSTGVLVAAAFLASIPVAIAYATFNYLAFYVVAPLDSVMREVAKYPEQHESATLNIAESAVNWYFFVVSWAILFIALSYAAKVRHAERRAALYRAEAQTAQLRALRYQINPHFLFNTLNSLSTLVLRQRTDEAERMIANLSTFFRTSLTADRAEDVPLADEIRLQRLYLDIEQIRFPDRLIVVTDIPPDLANAAVPGLILQPLVENAIKHGVARSSRPVTLTIRAREVGSRLHLSVEDDGDGGDVEAAGGHSVGLRNVCDRLAARYDGAATCQYGPRLGGGFSVELAMPLQRDA